MFIQQNRTRAKLRAGHVVYGVISTSDDPQTAELCGIAGFDYYMLDAEHGLIDAAQAVNVVRACERSNITPLVRIGPKDPKLVLQYLDAGMMGVMMPGIETVAELSMLVDAVKYPPQGKRGLGLSRASAYMAYGGSAPEYIAFANRETMVIPQFETAALIESLPELLAVPGVDALMIGPRDLSLQMGFADSPDHADVQAMIERVIGACNRAAVSVGITAATRSDAVRQTGRGARMIATGAQNLLLAGCTAFLPQPVGD